MAHPVIVTKYFGPTNSRGSRIRASYGKSSITIPYDSERSSEDNHRLAAHVLAGRMFMHGGELIQGMLDDGRNVWLFVAKDEY